MQFFNLLPIFLFVISFLLLFTKLKIYNSQAKRLPPGPWKVPFLGSLLHMVGGLPHRVLRDLAIRYGPLMHLQLGEVSAVVISSAEMAKEVLKTHDLIFASRPKLLAVEIIDYGGCGMSSPYGDYYRQMRKIVVMEVLSAKHVRTFSSIRRDEVIRMIKFLRSSSGKPVNITKSLLSFTRSMTCRSIFGKEIHHQEEFSMHVKNLLALVDGFDLVDIFPSLKFLHLLSGKKGKIMGIHQKVDAIVEKIINDHKKNHEIGQKSGELGGEDLIDVFLRIQKEGGLQFPITNDNIKAIIFDLFAAGTETSSITVDWAMAELMKNPNVFSKAQAEVREAFKRKETFDERDVEELKYLKLVIKETLRLHPPGPFLPPRECSKETNINGYTIPLHTTIMVNIWAIGRDPKHWDNAEKFMPERFENNSMDFTGNNFEFIPFGSGRRMCPGISFGLANVYFPLAQLLCHFDWKLPNGINSSDLDMTETNGANSRRTSDLYLIPSLYQPS